MRAIELCDNILHAQADALSELLEELADTAHSDPQDLETVSNVNALLLSFTIMALRQPAKSIDTRMHIARWCFLLSHRGVPFSLITQDIYLSIRLPLAVICWLYRDGLRPYIYKCFYPYKTDHLDQVVGYDPDVNQFLDDLIDVLTLSILYYSGHEDLSYLLAWCPSTTSSQLLAMISEREKKETRQDLVSRGRIAERLLLRFFSSQRVVRVCRFIILEDDENSRASCDHQRSVKYCALGIDAKHQGNYKEALSCYTRAREADFTNPYVYKNSAKVLIGTNRHDEALRHILTYVHLNILTHRYDPNMPAMAFAVPQIDFALTEYDWAGSIDDHTTIPVNYVRSRCTSQEVLQRVAIEIDMTANAGICYAQLHDAIVSKHRIPHSMFEAQAEIYVGKSPSSQNIRDSEHEHLMSVIGFAFLDANLSLEEDDAEQVCTMYFDASRALKPLSVKETAVAPRGRYPLADVARQAVHTVGPKMSKPDIIAYCDELDSNDQFSVTASRGGASGNAWDWFCPGNFLERLQPIERKPFHFDFSYVRVGVENEILAFPGKLLGEVDTQGTMHVSFPYESFQDVANSFQFSEISENGNRIMWSKDLENTEGTNGVLNVPDLMSLFYRYGELLRVYLMIDNPGVRIDLWAPSYRGSGKT